eukprot:COSAG01_NODE_4432_length_5031_cov_3.848540_6_plen_66_part_00
MLATTRPRRRCRHRIIMMKTQDITSGNVGGLQPAWITVSSMPTWMIGTSLSGGAVCGGKTPKPCT